MKTEINSIREVPLCKADITNLEKQRVLEVLDSGYLSNGPKLVEFEKKISEFINVPYVIGVNSGTSALHLAVRALGLKEGDEVITTPFSFIASSNCLLMENVTPVFSDIDPLTYNLDSRFVEEKITSKTKAILPVDAFGHPVDLDKFLKISEQYGLSILEDTCEALGSKYKGESVGKKADFGAFGFFPNKQITTGEGGVVFTSDEGLARLCKSMRAHGRNDRGDWLSHDRLGYNYKLSELNAAVGLAQMERIDEILSKRTKVANEYLKKLGDVEEIILPHQEEYADMSWFCFVVRFKDEIRNNVMAHLQKNKIGCRDYFSPIHLQPFYKQKFGFKEGDFPITEAMSKRTLALPFYHDLSEEEMNYVVDKLKEGIVIAKK